MNAHDAVVENLDILRKVKAQVCDDARGPEDLMPLLLIEWEGGERALVGVPERELLAPSVKFLRQERGDGAIASLTFCTDVLIREYDPENDPDAPKSPADVQRGDLTAEREAGDMRVQDALVVTAVDVKGDLVATMQRYGYGDGGELEWGDTTDLTAAGVVDGGVPDALREAIR